MIGKLPAATDPIDRQHARIEQVGVIGAGSGGIEGRMFEKPDRVPWPARRESPPRAPSSHRVPEDNRRDRR